MNFKAIHYLDAAKERVTSAYILYENGQYSASIYFSGVAVESLFRAYGLKHKQEFDSRHDLVQLMRTSSIGDFIPTSKQQKFGKNLTIIWMRWKNNYRYASMSRLRSEFRRMELNRHIKGNFLKENARIVFNAAQEIINAGVLRWN